MTTFYVVLGLAALLITLLTWWTRPWPRPDSWRSKMGRVTPR